MSRETEQMLADAEKAEDAARNRCAAELTEIAESFYALSDAVLRGVAPDLPDMASLHAAAKEVTVTAASAAAMHGLVAAEREREIVERLNRGQWVRFVDPDSGNTVLGQWARFDPPTDPEVSVVVTERCHERLVPTIALVILP